MIPPDASPVERALLERPSFSLRFRITAAFALAILFSCGIGVASITFISHMDRSQTFFEQAENFSSEMQQARRYEKNYFLYGAMSDLYDALNHTHAARSILEDTSEIRGVMGPAAYSALEGDLNEYEELLDRLASEHVQDDGALGARDPSAEGKLRHHGHRILTYADAMVKRERSRMHSTASSLRLGAMAALIINILAMVWVATELTRAILRPLGRAVQYTQRIARGDFTPITPRRKYRDEFSDLAIAINRMIDELKRNQEQLLQSRKMSAVGTLTSGIAHELNNPLNNISITVEALLNSYGDYTEEQKLKMLRDVFTQTERAGDTVRNLLDFTRIDQSRLESVDVQDLVLSSIKLVRNELTLRSVETEVDVGDDLPHIRGYFRNLQQVFLNLFLNAIQAMRDGGKLSVRAKIDGKRFVRVDVEDTGCGIAPENIDKVFDPFFTTKAVGQGTGLGLAVSYTIIQKIGGRLEIQSEEGKGTTVSVILEVYDDGE